MPRTRTIFQDVLTLLTHHQHPCAKPYVDPQSLIICAKGRADLGNNGK